MGEVIKSLKFPLFEDVVNDNYYHLTGANQEHFQQIFLKEQGKLEWVLETIQYPLFGMERYPSIADKAALLAWTIIKGHIFWDGNKRTGMSVLITFLRSNGYRLNITPQEIVEIALQVAGKDTERIFLYEEFLDWIRKKLILNR